MSHDRPIRPEGTAKVPRCARDRAKVFCGQRNDEHAARQICVRIVDSSRPAEAAKARVVPLNVDHEFRLVFGPVKSTFFIYFCVHLRISPRQIRFVVVGVLVRKLQKSFRSNLELGHFVSAEGLLHPRKPFVAALWIRDRIEKVGVELILFPEGEFIPPRAKASHLALRDLQQVRVFRDFSFDMRLVLGEPANVDYGPVGWWLRGLHDRFNDFRNGRHGRIGLWGLWRPPCPSVDAH